jgi:DNA topoisomerase-3
MRLFIAEKPSLGKAIAEALPKPLKKSDGFITASNGDTVSWCIGHLLELQEPEGYDPAFKKWSHDHLPIVPASWKLVAKKKTAKQLGVLRKLVKQADVLIHAGDPDREGQLLVDELINFLGVNGTKKATTLRCLINDLNPSAVTKAVNNLRSNSDFIPLSTSALARSRADWLYGINLTRAYTLQGKQAGYKGVLSVGRVQTPVLGLVVKRDLDIENFTSKAFFEVWANLQTGTGEHFKAKWQPSEQCERYLDEQGRNLSRPLAENVAGRINGQPAEVINVKRDHKKIAPPLPYSLSTLQIDASKAFGMSAQQVLDICQNLYEKHKLITYPRSDCRYIPTEHFKQASQVVAAISHNLPTLNKQPINSLPLNLKQKSKAWNDSKVSAHHAIIPTLKKTAALKNDEERIYQLVSRNYLAQFLPHHEYASTKADITIAKGLFIAKANEMILDGWKMIFPARKRTSNHSDSNDSTPSQTLPTLEKDQLLNSLEADVLEKHTAPPQHYTDATLLGAMTGIGAHVTDPDIKKILRETDGLGTEATRASIIELLFKRGFLQRKGKTITATKTGVVFITALPSTATTPDMTAQWESQLSSIASGHGKYQQLMTPLEQQLRNMTLESRSILPTELNGLGTAKNYRKKRAKKKSTV